MLLIKYMHESVLRLESIANKTLVSRELTSSSKSRRGTSQNFFVSNISPILLKIISDIMNCVRTYFASYDYRNCSRYKTCFPYVVGTYIFISCYVMLPLSAPLLDIISPLNETRLKRMPHASEYFVDQDKYYYVLMLNTYISYIVCVMIVVAADSIFMPLVAHICGLYAILW